MLVNSGAIRAEGFGTSPVVVTSTVTSGVRLRLAWNAATQVLTASYSTDNGATYQVAKSFSVGTEWTPGFATSGFFFDVFGNSNAADAIPAGAVHYDNFSLTATSPVTTMHTILVTDATGLIGRSLFRLSVEPAGSGTISGLAPAVAQAGDTVTIDGSGFTGATAVRFNGVDAASFTVVSATRITAVVPAGATSGPVTVVTPAGPIASSVNLTVLSGPRLRSIVDRAPVGTGENVLYASFTIEGASNKPVLLRGVGPSLAALDVSGFLADPRLLVYNAAGAVIHQNDNWSGDSGISAAAVTAGANPAFAAADSKDAALLVTLAPGTYTARLGGVGHTTGVGQLEVHEVDLTGRLVHASNRSRPAAGSPSVLGFSLQGTGTKQVLIRASGRGLVPQLGASVDPSIAVFQGTTSLASNDNWNAAANSAALETASASAGAPPLAEGDAAVLLTLGEGSYTVQTGTANGAAGFALTQVFVLDDARPASFPPALISPILGRRVALGARVIFNAPVLAKPGPVTFTWERIGGTLVPNTAFGPSTFMIPSAAAADAGAYQVRMNNTAGETVSTLVGLAVDAHAADSNGDGAIDLFELTRVIELYNTRNGTVRTGRYLVNSDSEDGFNPDATTANTATVSLPRHHSADPDKNGKIDLFELTRVIELFNHRDGTVRTGQYRVQAGTEDGFGVGPAPAP